MRRAALSINEELCTSEAGDIRSRVTRDGVALDLALEAKTAVVTLVSGFDELAVDIGLSVVETIA